MGRIFKKACTDLHNQKTVISSAKKLPPINQNIAYQRIIAYIDRLEKLFSNEKEYDEKTYERLRNRIFELICE